MSSFLSPLSPVHFFRSIDARGRAVSLALERIGRWRVKRYLFKQVPIAFTPVPAHTRQSRQSPMAMQLFEAWIGSARWGTSTRLGREKHLPSSSYCRNAGSIVRVKSRNCERRVESVRVQVASETDPGAPLGVAYQVPRVLRDGPPALLAQELDPQRQVLRWER